VGAGMGRVKPVLRYNPGPVTFPFYRRLSKRAHPRRSR
jgi:hypothetical protein